jgi:hypothetical protein
LKIKKKSDGLRAERVLPYDVRVERALPHTRFTVQLIRLDTIVFERVRASLRGSPFHFTLTQHFPAPAEGDGRPDLYVTRAQDLEEVAAAGVPVIAFGPAGLLRGAFLGGCADYLRDPWLPEELELRALAVLSRVRRSFEFPWGTASFEGTGLRTPCGLVPLTHHEAAALRVLLRSRGEPVPRSAIACELWGSPARSAGRAVDVHVASVRRKVRLVETDAGRFITCVRGKGYMVP